MSHIEVDPPLGVVPLEAPPAADGSTGAGPAGALTARRRLHPARVWVLSLIAGLLAGLISWLIGEMLHRRFEHPTPDLSGPPSSAQMMAAIFRAERTAQTSEATLAFGALGGVLGLALGLAGGSAQRSARVALGAAIVGSILGGAAGAALIKVILPLYFRILDPDTNEMIVGILFHVVMSSAIGAVGGAAFGIGLVDRSRAIRAVLGGLLGAAAGAFVYEVVGAVAFPLAKTSSPIATSWGARLLARLTVPILASAGVANGALDQVKGAIPSPVSEGHES
jgi:hypothetical protein